MMKLMYKGLLKDDKTLREVKIFNGVKMMVVGSTLDDVLTIQPPNPKELKAQKVEQAGDDFVTANVCSNIVAVLALYDVLLCGNVQFYSRSPLPLSLLPPFSPSSFSFSATSFSTCYMLLLVRV